MLKVHLHPPSPPPRAISDGQHPTSRVPNPMGRARETQGGGGHPEGHQPLGPSAPHNTCRGGGGGMGQRCHAVNRRRLGTNRRQLTVNRRRLGASQCSMLPWTWGGGGGRSGPSAVVSASAMDMGRARARAAHLSSDRPYNCGHGAAPAEHTAPRPRPHNARAVTRGRPPSAAQPPPQPLRPPPPPSRRRTRHDASRRTSVRVRPPHPLQRPPVPWGDRTKCNRSPGQQRLQTAPGAGFSG